jgi:hypothetical protein
VRSGQATIRHSNLGVLVFAASIEGASNFCRRRFMKIQEEIDMAEQPTCGRGLASHSPLAASVAELTDAVASNLDVHMRALDPTDENARREHAAYLRLSEEHRRAAAELRAIGQEMAGYHDLPMGRHDPEAMTSPDVAAAFRRFVNAERDLLALLQRRLEQDQRMLAGMNGSGGGAG